MAFVRLRRLVRFRGHAVVLAMIVTLAIGVTVALANEAWQSERARQAGAARALREYARFAAITFRQRVEARLYTTIVPILRPIADPRSAKPGGPLPDVEELRTLAEQAIACRCGPALHPTRYFRVTYGARDVTVLGANPTSRELAMLSGLPDSIGSLATSMSWEYGTIHDVSGTTPQVTVVSLRRGPDKAPRAVYGFSVPSAPFNTLIFQSIASAASLLPLTPAELVPNDSIMSVAVGDTSRPTFIASTTSYERRFVASIPYTGVAGFSTIHVALNPAVAPNLLVGGLPASRTPLVVALSTFCIVLLAAAIGLAWRATELARIRSEFVANVSHELRTPLAQVLLFSETLSFGRMTTRREVKRAADIIVGETRRLMQLVDNVLLFGRRDRVVIGKLEPVQLAPLVRDVVAAFQPLALSAEATVREARLEDCVVPGCRAELRQVILNLLDNAVKYGPRGQNVTVGVTQAHDGRTERVRIWIEDQGAGIPPLDRARVWEPFVRLERDIDAETAGSGIGLAVVHDIVVRHHGSTHIEDAAGGGARVVIDLPTATAES